MAEYLGTLDVLGLHQEIMSRYGRSSEIRDGGESAIESALARPQWAAHYQNADLAQQTALLMLGIAEAHPFVDGNKRLALAAGTVFIQLNGYLVRSRPREFAQQLRAALLASNKEPAITDFAVWLRSRVQF